MSAAKNFGAWHKNQKAVNNWWPLTFGIHWHWAPLGLFPGAKIWLWAWVPLHARPWQCGLIATIWALMLPSLGLQVWVNLADGSPSQPLNVHWGKCGESMWMVGNWLFHEGQDFGQVKSHAVVVMLADLESQGKLKR